MTVSDIMKELDFTILDICDDYLSKIMSIIFANINNYNPEEDNWADITEAIENSVYECLVEVFITVSKTISEVYKDAKEFEVKDVFNLCYSVDGKNITDRIKEYLDKIHNDLAQSKAEIDIKSEAISKFDRLLTTEASNVETAVKKIESLKVLISS